MSSKILIFAMLLVASSFALNYTMSADGKYVSWENSNALINCTAYSNELVHQTQICDFKYKGTPTITLNTSLVFNTADGVTPKAAYIWQNISHTLYRPVSRSSNHSLEIMNVTNIATTTAPCDWGAGAIKRNVTNFIDYGSYNYSNSYVYCFDTFQNNSPNYVVYSVFNTTVQEPYTAYFYDWNDISSAFKMSQFGSYKVGTIEAAWTSGQTRRVKFDYNTEPNTNGKFDIYFHTGTAAQAKSNPANIKMVLDPWWDSSWKACEQINITNNYPANYTHRITLNTSLINYTKAKADLTDLRFLEGTCTTPNTTAGVLDMWIQDVNTTATSNVMFQTVNPNIATVAMYFNNSAATSISNATTVAIFGDDFANGINLTTTPSSWKELYNEVISAHPNITGGELTYNTINTAAYWSVRGPNSYTASSSEPIQIISRMRTGNTTPNGQLHAIGFWANTTNYFHWFQQKWAGGTPNLIGKRDEKVAGAYNEANLNTSATDTTYREYGILWNGSQANLTINGISYGTRNINPTGWTPSLKVQTAASNGNADYRYDYYFVMKYAFPQPTYAIGAEEAAPAGVTSGPLSVAVTLPTNATYTSRFINVSALAYGDNASYYINFTANGNNIIHDQTTGNNSQYSQIYEFTSNGGYQMNATAWNGTYQNTSSSVYFTVNDVAPTVGLIAPSNASISTNSTWYFDWMCNDTGNTTMNYRLFLDNTLSKTGVCTNATSCTDSIAGIPTGNHYWNVECSDGLYAANATNYNFTEAQFNFVSPTPLNGVNNFTYGLVFNYSSNTDLGLAGNYIEIDGINKTCTLAGTLSCAYVLPYEEHLFNNSYDLKIYANISGNYLTNATLYNFSYYGCGYIQSNATMLGNATRNGGNCFTTNSTNNLIINGAGYAIGGNDAAATTGIHINYTNNTVIKNAMIENFYTGIYTQGTETNVTNTTIRDCAYGMDIESGTNLTNSSIYNNTIIGIQVRGTESVIYNNSIYNNTNANLYIAANNLNASDNLIYNSTIGIDARERNNVSLSKNHYHNNTWDLAINGTNYNASSELFDSNGSMANYTNISFSVANTNGTINFTWTTNSSALASGTRSFRGKYLNISSGAGTPILDTITFNWLTTEVGTFDESKFHLYKYNGTWTDLNSTPDTINNQLKLSALSPAGNYAIVEWWNDSLCLNIIDLYGVKQNTSQYLQIADTWLYIVADNITLNNTCPIDISVDYKINESTANASWITQLASFSANQVKNVSNYSYRIPMASSDLGEIGANPAFFYPNNHHYRFNSTYTSRNVTNLQINISSFGDYRALYKCENEVACDPASDFGSPLTYSLAGSRILRSGDTLDFIEYVVSWLNDGGAGPGGGGDAGVAPTVIPVPASSVPTLAIATEGDGIDWKTIMSNPCCIPIAILMLIFIMTRRKSG